MTDRLIFTAPQRLWVYIDDPAEVEYVRADLVPDLSAVISWLENGCDPKEAAKELRMYRDAMLPRKERP